MSTPRPYAGIVKAAVIANVRLTQGAMGLGFGGFGIALVDKADDTATWETEPTAYAALDASADSDLVSTLQALCEGDVPGLDVNGSPILWGQDDIIAQADVIAAWGSENVKVVSLTGYSSTEREAALWANVDSLGYKERPSFVMPG